MRAGSGGTGGFGDTILAGPVDTGRLRRSITGQASGLAGKVGTNVHYAIYVEFGTCKMAAQPYLIPGLLNKEQEVVEVIKAALAGL